jgi:hypothetical protein
MNQFEFYSPTKVIFGRGAENKAGKEIKAQGGTKVLVHFGQGSVQKSGLLDRVMASLKAEGIETVLLGGAKPNPRVSLVKEGIALCRQEKIDFILAVGGGSAIDSAKAIALGVPYDGDVWDFFERKSEPKSALPHANILTLAATGSETSMSTVITNEDGWLKKGTNSDFNRPRFTLMNPELLFTLPPWQTASGVVDIMLHTFERYFSAGGINEVTDRIAEAILRTVIQYGKVCIDDPTNYDARSEVFWAGSLSHNGLTGLGRVTDWACHQLEHELGGLFDVTHGAGLAAVWGAWARYVYQEDVMRFARFGVNVWGLNLNYENPEETALAAIQATQDFFKSISMPITTTELLGRETTDEEMREMALKCTYYGARKVGTFKVLLEDDLYQIYQNAR